MWGETLLQPIYTLPRLPRSGLKKCESPQNCDSNYDRAIDFTKWAKTVRVFKMWPGKKMQHTWKKKIIKINESKEKRFMRRFIKHRIFLVINLNEEKLVCNTSFHWLGSFTASEASQWKRNRCSDVLLMLFSDPQCGKTH